MVRCLGEYIKLQINWFVKLYIHFTLGYDYIWLFPRNTRKYCGSFWNLFRTCECLKRSRATFDASKNKGINEGGSEGGGSDEGMFEMRKPDPNRNPRYWVIPPCFSQTDMLLFIKFGDTKLCPRQEINRLIQANVELHLRFAAKGANPPKTLWPSIQNLRLGCSVGSLSKFTWKKFYFDNRSSFI